MYYSITVSQADLLPLTYSYHLEAPGEVSPGEVLHQHLSVARAPQHQGACGVQLVIRPVHLGLVNTGVQTHVHHLTQPGQHLLS